MERQSYKFWTAPQRALIVEHYRTKGGPWCSAQTGRTLSAVHRFARSIGAALPKQAVEHPSNPEMDRIIRRAYESGRNGAVVDCAKALGKSKAWVFRRGAELGLTTRRRDYTPWSPEEEAIVEEHAHCTRLHISKLLRKRGYRRSARAVQDLISRRGLSGAQDRFLTPPAIAAGFGVDPSTVLKWIRAGDLKTSVKERDQTGQTHKYLVEDIDLASMVVRHPTMFNLAKADAAWLIDLIARHGAAGLVEAKDKGSRIVAIKQAFPERTAAEIAAMVDSTPAAVSVTLSKAKARLQSDARSAA